MLWSYQINQIMRIIVIIRHPELKSMKTVKLVPEISKSDYQSLKTSIKEDGLFSNILNQHGVILDGHHRYRANQELGIEPSKDIKY